MPQSITPPGSDLDRPAGLPGVRFLHVLVPAAAHARARQAAKSSSPPLTFREYITRVMMRAEPFVESDTNKPSSATTDTVVIVRPANATDQP